MALVSQWTTWISLLLLLQAGVAVSQTIVKTLPGYSGDLPFKLETGYIGVGESEDVQLFYYFFESERNPRTDPLMLWLTGGPGCSGFSGLVYEIGPLIFNYNDLYSTQPTFSLNPYSWTKIANVIFLDQPVGTGYSYTTLSESYLTSDTKSAAQTYDFLQKWLVSHPLFITNPLYISGDSYSGIIVPIVTQEISIGNEAGSRFYMNLQGYSLGNPLTEGSIDFNSRVQFAHHMALISEELYESAKNNCNGNFLGTTAKNTQCQDDLTLINKCLEKVLGAHILEPVCNPLSPLPNGMDWKGCGFDYQVLNFIDSLNKGDEQWCMENPGYSTTAINLQCMGDSSIVDKSQEKTLDSILEPFCKSLSQELNSMSWNGRRIDHSVNKFLVSPNEGEEQWCRYYNYLLSYVWANNKLVQKALGVREGSIASWVRCSKSLHYSYEGRSPSYIFDVTSVVEIHRNLSKLGYQALIYSGDHDYVIPHIGTEQWIKSLNLTVYSHWRPWFVDGEVAGYTVRYENTANNYLTYATVKGAGHTAPEYKPNECLALIDRWLAGIEL